MPKTRQKKTASQLAALDAGRKRKLQRSLVELNVFDQDLQNENQQDEFSEFVCAFEQDNDTMSFYMDDIDENFYYDSGNDDVTEEDHYISHGLVFGRKHSKIFELVDNQIRFVPYNGDPTDLMQVLGVPYKKDGSIKESTIGISKYLIIKEWADHANKNARSGIKNPKIRGCRSVRDATLSTDGMDAESVFPFFLYGRGLSVTNKLKGVVRRAVVPKFVMNAPDCTGTLEIHLPYILRKLAGTKRFLTTKQQENIANYADRKGLKIVPANGFFGPKVVPK